MIINLTLEFVKKPDNEKIPKKSAEKTLEQYRIILENMQPDVWYKISEFESVLGVGERRIRNLFSALCEEGRVEVAGSTKGKNIKKYYRKN